ncbi:MAG: bifunctional demethylmenaquinone methyltransferase/2-methoxy-6-polyprenyl-1,4-benzoquinol methylase UbiE [Planctomycetes bacterium]|nr:bifunctional demethylmenaquinone methyltransferase/2-methoxy-6-polyprenyl-1,4-benzoquinol methylase UbiE [Planctomycetota bacterium]
MPPSPAPSGPASPTAWDDAELANPHRSSEKAGKVRSMFSAIAGSYDLNNRVHSLWQDQAWRRYAVKTADVQPAEHVLDVACGTGDLTQAFALRSPASRVVGLDFTAPMLDVAREKQKGQPKLAAEKISYIEGDAQKLPFADASFNVVSIAFGIRNVASPAAALAEFRRVLRPGGRLVILEFDTPRFPPMRWFNNFYCGWIMPRTATLISGDRSGAYKYLPKSVGTFMSREQLLAAMSAVGFTQTTARPLSLGICVCYKGIVPDAPAR